MQDTSPHMNQFKYIKFAECNPSNFLHQKRNSLVVFKSWLLGKQIIKSFRKGGGVNLFSNLLYFFKNGMKSPLGVGEG